MEIKTLAFDIGGTRIKAGVVQGDTVHALQVLPLNAERQTQSIVHQLQQIGSELMQSYAVQAVGLSVKGIIDSRRGMILDVNEALMDLIEQPFVAMLAQTFGLPVFIENDARVYALGELLYGAGRNVANMVCLTLGTGIGCGVTLNRQLLRGSRGLAGVLGGHITIQVDGPCCSCGNVGCLESFVGTPALLRAVETGLQTHPDSILHSQPHITPHTIFMAAEQNDMLAHQIVKQFSRYLGAGIVSLIHAYDPDIVVLGGGISGAAHQFLPSIQSYVNEHVWTLPDHSVPIVKAKLGDTAALVGVAALANQQAAFI
jgi:glucokinase